MGSNIIPWHNHHIECYKMRDEFIDGEFGVVFRVRCKEYACCTCQIVVDSNLHCNFALSSHEPVNKY
jgi:hypothetical protein